MTTKPHRALASVCLLGLGFALAGANCTQRSLCEKRAECASDPPGEDYVNICTEKEFGYQNALRANSEEDCQRLATAVEALQACMATLDCDDFTENDLGGNCDDELDEYDDAWDDASNGGSDLGGRAVSQGGLGPAFAAIPKDCSSWD